VAQNLVRLKTYAEEHPISVKSLRRYIATGKIRGYRFGPKIILVDENEVDAVLLKPIPNGRDGQ
jgi:hypothetical protein